VYRDYNRYLRRAGALLNGPDSRRQYIPAFPKKAETRLILLPQRRIRLFFNPAV
jgi:hypothetical protein